MDESFDAQKSDQYDDIHICHACFVWSGKVRTFPLETLHFVFGSCGTLRFYYLLLSPKLRCFQNPFFTVWKKKFLCT